MKLEYVNLPSDSLSKLEETTIWVLPALDEFAMMPLNAGNTITVPTMKCKRHMVRSEDRD